MTNLLRKRLLVVALASALVGISSVAVAEEDEEAAEVVVEEEVAEEGSEVEVAEEQTAEEDESADEEESEVEEVQEEVAEEESEVEEAKEEIVEEESEVEEAQEEVAEEESEVEEAEAGEEPEEAAGDEVPVNHVESEDETTDPWANEEEQAQQDEEEVEPAEEVEAAEENAEDPWAEVEEELEEEVLAENGDDGEFSPTLAIGIDTGYVFGDLQRFNDYILEPNNADPFEVIGTQHIDLVVESEVVENLRISILGGMTYTWQQDPSLFGWYVGVEPAFVAGDDVWEMAIGTTIGVGGLRLTSGDDEVSMSLTVLRPFLEVRRFITDSTAGYVRAGFNQWYPRSPSSETFDLTAPTGARELAAPDLAQGGIFVAAGFRFGALSGLIDDREELSEE